MKKLFDNLYLASAIARKDIADALKNKASRTNIIFLFGMLLFFYWGSTIRPYDKDLQIVYIDQGSSSLVSSASLVGDATYRFSAEVDTLDEMSTYLESRELGVVIPADFDQQLETKGTATLQGYIAWVHRAKAAELAAKYSEDFSTLTGKNVIIEIGSTNALKPAPHGRNSTPIAIFVYLLVFMALSVVPYLMLEEKKSKTMDALLVSPANPGTLVLGKALTGLFYLGVIVVVFFVVYSAYFTNWGLAILTALLIASFAIGLALLLGSLVKSPQHLQLWNLPIILLVVIPAFFVGEEFLPPALNQFFSWLPTTAMTELFRFSLSSGVIEHLLWRDLALSAAGIALVFSVLLTILRRSDR
jgi:ABC-type Na+ efflux pump permease subunit